MQRYETPNLYNLAHSKAQMRMPYAIGISNGRKRDNTSEVFSPGSLEKRSRQELGWPASSIAYPSRINVKRSPGIHFSLC